MNLTSYQKKQIGYVLILLAGIPATIFAVYQGIKYLAKAEGDTTPVEVIVSNVTTNSLTVSWVTEKAVEGYVIPVLSGTEQTVVSDKRGDSSRTSHYVELKSLEPSTEYSFIILSDDQRYTNGTNGEYKFSTAPIGEDTPVPNPVYGYVEGGDVANVIVYIMFSDKSVYPVSSDVPSNGNWIMQLSSLRKVSDKSMVRTTDDTELIILAREGVNKGVVLQGSYSTLFDSDGKLVQKLVLEEVGLEELQEYFPDETMLDNTPVPTPTPVIPKPSEEPAEEPDTEWETTYVIRNDIVWENLVTDVSPNLASGESTVTISNLSDTNFNISWRSANKEQGYVKYGTSKTDLSGEMLDTRDSFSVKGQYYSHHIESGRLSPDTTYFFEIYSGNTLYDNGGLKYTIETLSTLDSAPPLDTRGGTVINASDPADWVLIFKIIDNDEQGTQGSSGYISVLPDTSGAWVLVIGDSRSEDGLSYFSFTNTDILQAYFLGADSKKFDFNLSQNDIQLDVSTLGGISTSGVQLLLDYGIVFE